MAQYSFFYAESAIKYQPTSPSTSCCDAVFDFFIICLMKWVKWPWLCDWGWTHLCDLHFISQIISIIIVIVIISIDSTPAECCTRHCCIRNGTQSLLPWLSSQILTFNDILSYNLKDGMNCLLLTVDWLQSSGGEEIRGETDTYPAWWVPAGTAAHHVSQGQTASSRCHSYSLWHCEICQKFVFLHFFSLILSNLS